MDDRIQRAISGDTKALGQLRRDKTEAGRDGLIAVVQAGGPPAYDALSALAAQEDDGMAIATLLAVIDLPFASTTNLPSCAIELLVSRRSPAALDAALRVAERADLLHTVLFFLSKRLDNDRGIRGDVRIGQAAARGLASPSVNERFSAATCLKYAPVPEALAPLIALLSTEEHHVLYMVTAPALGAVGGPKAAAALEARAATFPDGDPCAKSLRKAAKAARSVGP